MTLNTQPHQHAYNLLMKDTYRLMEYVEPVDANEKTYSHRIFELLLRACTEFEALCKGLLVAGGSKTKPEDMTAKDYRDLETAYKLSDWQVRVYFWRTDKVVQPFAEWKNLAAGKP